jgi:formate dehydrogenase major subunit
MKITRRDFLKFTGLSAVSLALASMGVDFTKEVYAQARASKISMAKESLTICPYCAVGCGIICHTSLVTKKVINTEGDPEHPINQGALCAKGAALFQLVNNTDRITSPLYRAPYSDKWEKVTWNWALERIAKRVKETRDKFFIQKDKKGNIVNRVEAIAHIGSAALDNEECYLIQQMMRGLGLVYIEHQARI